MNENAKKKRNTAIFVLIATVLNIVLMLVFMLIGYILLVRFGNPDNHTGTQIWLIVIFLGSIGLSWLIYSRIIKWYTKRVDVEKKFAPLITPRARKKRQTEGEDPSMKG